MKTTMTLREKCAEAVFQLTEAIAAYEKYCQPNPAWHQAAVALVEELEKHNFKALWTAKDITMIEENILAIADESGLRTMDGAFFQWDFSIGNLIRFGELYKKYSENDFTNQQPTLPGGGSDGQN